MICALCDRRITKKDIAARRYVHSRFTKAYYCLRADCQTVYTRRKRKLVSA